MEVINKEKVLEHAKRLIDEGKYDRAIQEYRRLLDADPKDMRIKLRIAELLARQKKIAEAVIVYKEVADSYSNDGFFLKAVTVYKNVLRLNPSLIDINFKLAELYEKMGLMRDAIHQYQILSNSLEQKGDYAGLTDVRKKIVDLDPHNIPNRIRLAETYQYQGKEEESLNEYENLVAEVKKGDDSTALIDLYEKILSYRPENIEMIRSICKIYYKRGEWKKIIGHMEKAGKLVENQTDLLVMEGDVYARLNQNETSKGKYKLAASLFIERGEVEKALDAYKEILVTSPDAEKEIREIVGEIDPILFDKIKADAEAKRKRMADVEAEMSEEEEEIAETPQHKVPHRLGSVLELSIDEAGKKIKDADGAYELGRAYHNMGLAGEAKAELSKALELYKIVVEGGAGSSQIADRIKEIESWLGLNVETETKVERLPERDEETIDLSQKPEAERKSVEESLKKAKEEVEKRVREKKKEKAQKKDKPKRDKRMGFV